jgi:hypothetical protein
MQVIEVGPRDDVEAAAWIGPRLRPFKSFQAGSFVPGGFQGYARIDHEREGVMPAELARALIGILGPESEAWLALWNGYGFLYPGRSFTMLVAFGEGSPAEAQPQPPYWLTPPLPTDGARLVNLPHRDYLLYRGTLDHVPGWIQGPNLWWPDDHSWFVASEIDLPWTCVGGSRVLIADVLRNAELSARSLSLDESTLAQDHPELGERP